MALSLSSSALAGATVSGSAGHDNVLLGMHFLYQNLDCNAKGTDPVDIAPSFWDYVKYMPEDLRHMSYADFWHWWHDFERYKGDEKGLAEFDRIVDACLEHGMKVKVDLAWSTWYTNDKDWENYSQMAIGPVDVDDWVHLCDLLGRRYRGRVALWLLQGEANDVKNYWQEAPMEHIYQVYRLGSRAFKQVDPNVMISVAGASPSVPREALDEWVKLNTAACKGLFDDVSMNYFGDTADPYKGMDNYYKSIRSILDELGEKDVEIGSGESSFQWAETSYDMPKNPATSMKDFDPDKTPLCELKQAWRCNESLGTFFDMGGTKWVQWGSEYAPGGGWVWRWGFRKYQDWWGAWPEDHKIPGTDIVYRWDNPDGRKVDLRPGWTSRQTDPYHPMWEVFRFWAQATPPGTEAVRIDSTATSSGPRVLKLTTYLKAQDRCVALLQSDDEAGVTLDLDLRKTEWPDATALDVRVTKESIDYAVGDRSVVSSSIKTAKVKDGAVEVKLPPASGFTTVEIRRSKPALDADCTGQAVASSAVVGKPIDCVISLRNTGRAKWDAKAVSLALADDGGKGKGWAVPLDVKPGELTSVQVRIPAPDATGALNRYVRMRDEKGQWFGPTFLVSVRVTDPDCPRKLVAFRELGHIRLKWFAPERCDDVQGYELYRAAGFGEPFSLLTKTESTDHIDSKVDPEKAYYYHVVAVRKDGSKSTPSNDDNAKASSKPRIWDAEIVEHTVPGRALFGEANTASITIRNTGTKAWNLGSTDAAASRVYLSTMQQWGENDESVLPRVYLGDSGTVKPGESVTVKVPYSGQREGRFENHWVVTLDTLGKARAFIGTPLLVETVVTPR